MRARLLRAIHSTAPGAARDALPQPHTLSCRATVRWWAAAAPKPMAFFCAAAGLTHLLSALGHVYPDSHSLEKADHLGIVLLIIGNPLSSLMVRLACRCKHREKCTDLAAVLQRGGSGSPGHQVLIIRCDPCAC